MNSKSGRIVSLLCMAAVLVIGLPMMNIIKLMIQEKDE